MTESHSPGYLKHLRHDIPAGVVVFLVALPLCLGIALACGAPLFSGLIAGMVGGLVVAWLSGSQLSVSGPAAGLTAIVVSALDKLGSFESFLLSLTVAGAMQLVLGFLRAGVIGAYFPAAVIKGMLAAIGLILIMKQLPHAVGYDVNFEGDESYLPSDAHTTFSEIAQSLHAISPSAVIVSLVAMLIMLLWDTQLFKRNRVLSIVPGPLVAVAWGIAYNLASQRLLPEFTIATEHLVNLPLIASPPELLQQFRLPDFSQFLNADIYVIALTMAIVASLETLLSLEAVDKLDPLKRVAPTNRELKAQGLGNIISGLLGGLPITAVIVRSAANVNAGGKTKMACFIHGLFLLLSVVFLAQYLNLIPLATLAAVLLLTGYKLAKPQLFMEMYRKGFNQLAPFAITVVAILLMDLLKGMAIGMAVGLYFVIRTNFHRAISLTRHDNHYLLRLHKDVSFLNKAVLRNYLDSIEADSHVVIDGTRARFVDQDILETIGDFLHSAPEDNIAVEVDGIVVPEGVATAHH